MANQVGDCGDKDVKFIKINIELQKIAAPGVSRPKKDEN